MKRNHLRWLAGRRPDVVVLGRWAPYGRRVAHVVQTDPVGLAAGARGYGSKDAEPNVMQRSGDHAADVVRAGHRLHPGSGRSQVRVEAGERARRTGGADTEFRVAVSIAHGMLAMLVAYR